MKKILSVVLSLIIVIGTLPAAYATGLSINKWNGFTGDGVTVSNPDPAADSDDDVIKLASGETATLSLTTPVSSNMLITFDFYAATAQDSTVEALAADDTVMGTFTLGSDGTACGDDEYRTGKWQTAQILIYPDGKMYRTYLDGAYLADGVIDTASLSLDCIKFTAGGELYINNISVSNYATPLLDEAMLETDADYSDEVETPATTGYAVEITENAMVEATVDAVLGDGTLVMSLTTDNEANPTVLELDSTTAPEGEFTVKVNISIEAQTADVYINDELASTVPVSFLAADTTAASEVSEVIFEVTGDASATVKSFYVKKKTSIKNPAGKSEKILYEENFDNEDAKVGSTVPYFDRNGGYEQMGSSFTAVDATTGHATSQVGMLKQINYGSAVYRLNDDGTPDTVPQQMASGIVYSWFSHDLSSKAEGIDNITLSFKYYNANNAMQNADGSGLSRDRLRAGFGTGTNTGNLFEGSSVAYVVNHGEQRIDLYENGAKKLDGSVVPSSIGKQWVDAELIITTNEDNTVTATVRGPKSSSDSTKVEESVTLASFPEISNLSFQLDRNYGGKYYLDDIKVTTIVTRDEDEYYTEDELMDISSAVTTPAYTNDITRVEVDVEAPDLPEGTVSETIENNKTTHYSNDFGTMGVYGFEESENLEAAAVYKENMGSVMSLTQKEAGSPAKAVYKIGSITDVWDGTVDTSWYDASADSYEIWSGADLAGLRKLVNESNTDFTGKTVKLMANIDLADKNWTPIGTGIDSNGFKGTFDGNGHEIRNLSIKDTVKDSESNTRYFGLFGRAEGRIANLGINGAKVIITSESIKPMHLAALASSFQGTMESCYVINSEVKEVRSETVEKQIKRISDGGTWTYSRDLVAPLIAVLGASSTVNGCYTRDTNIYASWHSISSPLIGMSSSGSASTASDIKNCYAAGPFTYAVNPATGERGRVYTMCAKSVNSGTTASNNYYSHTVEEFRGPGNGEGIPEGEKTTDIYGNGFGTFELNSQIYTVAAGALLTSLESTNLYTDDIANVNAGHPILKSQRLKVDAAEMNVAFEAMVPPGSDADLVLYSGNEVAATISLTDIAEDAWKTIDIAFRNGTYIPTVNGVEGEAVEFASENDGVSEFAFVVNNGTAYIENLMIYQDSAELLKKKINKIMADIYNQVPDYPVLTENLTLPETVDGYSVTWKSSNKSYITDKGEILARKDCTFPVSLTATITLDPVNTTYPPADAQVTFTFDLAPAEGVDDEKTVDAIIADILESTYITEESHNAISKDLNTLPTEWDGASILWEVVSGTAMDAEGKVTIPETENEDVTLKATVTLGDVEKSTELDFTVLSYDKILEYAAAAVTYELINGADGNIVKKNLNFPSSGLYGTTITWESGRKDLITDKGFLMEINDEEPVEITATIKVDGVDDKEVSVPFYFVTYISPTVKLAADMAKVTVQAEADSDMTLPVRGEDYNSQITWASNSTYAQVNGARINITRPENVVGDTEVTLTATFEIDGVTISKDYKVLVKCLPANEVILDAEIEQIDFTDISDELQSAVQGNLHLVYDFPYGITATWISDSDFVTNDGIVTRPPIGNPDEDVIMTLTLERGGVERTTEIRFTVKAYGTTQEVLDYAKAQLTFNTLSDEPINLVVDDLFLPKAWKFGTEVSWTSDSALIEVVEGTDGHYKGKVTKAAYGAPNTPVLLRATISYEGETVTKDFYVTVSEQHGYEPLIYTDFELLTRGVNYAADRNNLSGGTYEHNNLYQITVGEADPKDSANTALKIYKTPDMEQLSGGNSWAFFRTNASQRRAGIIRIEQDIYLESMSNVPYRIVGSVGGGKDGNYEEINVNVDHEGNIYQWKSDYTASKKMEFRNWNTLAIEFSTYEKWVDIYLNGDLVLDNAPFQYNKDGTEISALKIKYEGLADADHVLYIDNLKVLRKVDYSGEMAAADKELEAAFLAAQNINAITGNIVLPDLSKYELEVSGTSSNANVVANDGTVTRPSKDTEVEYTVTISSEFGGTRSRKFKLLVKSDSYVPGESGGTVSDAQKAIADANAAIEALKNSYTLNYVTASLALPTTAANGSTITWKSLSTSVISDSGVVKRPTSDTTVTLICTATLNGVSDRKEVQVTVKASTSIEPSGSLGSTSDSSGGSTGGGLSGVMPYEPPKTGNETPSETPNTSSTVFNDVKDHWAKDYIMELYDLGVINGVSETEFAPNNSISREAFLTMLIRALGNELSEDYGEVFDDVRTDDWYYQYVMEGYKMGIVNGTTLTEFGTGANISRQDLCTMIARALEAKGIEMDTEAVSEFADHVLIEIYAKDAIYGLQNLGIINGKDNNFFDPRGIATRAEAAKIMAGLMDVLTSAE